MTNTAPFKVLDADSMVISFHQTVAMAEVYIAAVKSDAQDGIDKAQEELDSAKQFLIDVAAYKVVPNMFARAW
jgi:hypothetical protein